MGGNYAARPSDTGSTGGIIDSGGGYHTAVPLELPQSRHGMPVPVSLRYTGRLMGAAGVGWGVPLTYIRRESTLSRQRPAGDPLLQGQAGVAAEAVAPERVYLVLDGERIDLVPKATRVWVPRYGAAELELHDLGDVWLMYDGEGRKYIFDDLVTGPSWPSGVPMPLLLGRNLFLLREIDDSFNGSEEIVPFVEEFPLRTGTGLSIELLRVRYNNDPVSVHCYKNQIVLRYNLASGEAGHPVYALTMMGDFVWVRSRVLTNVEVYGHAPDAPCDDVQAPAPGYVQLRNYELQQSLRDPDTLRPQLSAVVLHGQEGTPEANQSIPIATYTYGAAADGVASANTLHYSSVGGGGDLSFNFTGDSFVSETEADDGFLPAGADPAVSSGFVTWKNFLDMNGDGRPDIVYREGNQLRVALNRPAGDGFYDLSFTEPLSDGVLPPGPLEVRSASGPENAARDSDQVWQQVIDWNGDGRLDVVRANEMRGKWVVYLNRPPVTPHALAPFTWERREVDIGPALAQLQSVGLALGPRGRGWGGFLPLSNRVTGRSETGIYCERWDESNPFDKHWVPDPSSFGTQFCPLVAPQVPPGRPVRAEVTFTEWELQDVNGDGFPDLVYGQPTKTVEESHQILNKNLGCPYLTELSGHGFPVNGSVGQVVECQASMTFELDTSRENGVFAMLNTFGMLMPDSSSPIPIFSLPVDLTANLAGASFGVAEWSTSLDATTQERGIVDVNGDGLPDYVSGQTVYLNSGVGEGGFTNVTMELPGPLGEQVNDRATACPGHEYQSETVATLRDINGDGIPDYIENGLAGPRVTLGTSGGFEFDAVHRTPGEHFIGTDGLTDFGLSVETESCGADFTVGKTSRTFRGLYDLDGDGKPEVLDAFGSSRLVLEGPSPSFAPGAPETGLLTSVGNGHGGTTEIRYRSAKEDATAFLPHLVPFPEIVVKSIQTRGAPGAGHDQVATFYAYAGIGMFYDNVVERFLPTGYQRTIEIHPKTGAEGTATITERFAPFDVSAPGAAPEVLFRRLAQAGRVSQTNVLVGSMDATNPWSLLSVTLDGDPRWKVSVTHSITAKLATESFDGVKSCIDLAEPFELGTSRGASAGFNACATHGFLYDSEVLTAEGAPLVITGSPFSTRTDVTVDDLGRTTDVRTSGDDVAARDQDRCVHTEYATPTPLPDSQARVLSAPSLRTVSDCNGTVLARQTFQYDQRTDGRVTAGFLSASAQSRLDENGQTAGADVGFTVSPTPDGFGNPYRVTTQRVDRKADGSQTVVSKHVDTTYDRFGLVATDVTTGGTGVSDQTVHIHYDELKLLPDRMTDPNQAVVGTSYDGFGRPTVALTQPAGGALGAVSCTRYLGFAQGEPGPRQVRTTKLVDAVDPQAVCGAAGTTTTATVDELGRMVSTTVDLGPSYGEGIVVAAPIYDEVGHVAFAPDPFPSSQNAATAYGTTHYYNADGTPACSIRGNGPQPPTAVTSLGSEVMATCFDRHVEGAREILTVTGPDGRKQRSERSPIGRVLTQLTLAPQSNGGDQTVRRADFEYDGLGHRTTVTRYRNPAARAEPVQWTMHFDSLGAVHEVDEPGQGTAPLLREYDDWGAVIREHWNDGVEHESFVTYDALGRPLHREQRTGGRLDADSVADFVYDVPASFPLDLADDHVVGRLSKSSSSSGSTFYTYDGRGRLAVRAFTSTDADQAGVIYYDQRDYHDDGSLKALHFKLPDNNHADERIDYGYDSAGRLRSVTSVNGVVSETLFEATSVDTLGRTRQARYAGGATYTAHYADVGRRLVDDVTVTPAPPALPREIHFGAFDVLGRETQRDEHIDGSVKTTASSYDALGRLATSVGTLNGAPSSATTFHYDPLGNLLSQGDSAAPGVHDVALGFGDGGAIPDLDRLCRVEYGRTTLQGGPCNVVYDGAGNVLTEPSRNGNRHMTYFADGLVHTLRDDFGNFAQFRYDGFGALQALDVQSADPSSSRRDRHFGELIEKRDVLDAGGPIIVDTCPGCDPPPPQTSSIIVRNVPGPGGILASRRGAGGPWVFGFGEQRGGRFFIDDTGAEVQSLEYRPFGDASSSGSAEPGTALYTPNQWNGGDSLEVFGLVRLGARLYDPAIGRFLGRDPLMAGHPYAFAGDDPVNFADPTGLCGNSENDPCPQPPIGPNPLDVVRYILSLFDGGGGAHGHPPKSVPQLPITVYPRTAASFPGGKYPGIKGAWKDGVCVSSSFAACWGSQVRDDGGAIPPGLINTFGPLGGVAMFMTSDDTAIKWTRRILMLIPVGRAVGVGLRAAIAAVGDSAGEAALAGLTSAASELAAQTAANGGGRAAATALSIIRVPNAGLPYGVIRVVNGVATDMVASARLVGVDEGTSHVELADEVWGSVIREGERRIGFNYAQDVDPMIVTWSSTEFMPLKEEIPAIVDALKAAGYTGNVAIGTEIDGNIVYTFLSL